MPAPTRMSGPNAQAMVSMLRKGSGEFREHLDDMEALDERAADCLGGLRPKAAQNRDQGESGEIVAEGKRGALGHATLVARDARRSNAYPSRRLIRPELGGERSTAAAAMRRHASGSAFGRPSDLTKGSIDPRAAFVHGCAMNDTRGKGLEGGLTNYGDPAFAAYLRRSFARSMGFFEELLGKPVVGIAQTASGFNNCHRGVPELVEAVKRGVLAAGALPLDFPVISLGEVSSRLPACSTAISWRWRRRR